MGAGLARDVCGRRSTDDGKDGVGQTWSDDAFGLEAERVVVTTDDGRALVAYAVDVPEPEAVIVFQSGTHDPSVTAFFSHAAWLADHGYASFLLEPRAHGESAGERIGLG